MTQEQNFPASDLKEPEGRHLDGATNEETTGEIDLEGSVSILENQVEELQSLVDELTQLGSVDELEVHYFQSKLQAIAGQSALWMETANSYEHLVTSAPNAFYSPLTGKMEIIAGQTVIPFHSSAMRFKPDTVVYSIVQQFLETRIRELLITYDTLLSRALTLFSTKAKSFDSQEFQSMKLLLNTRARSLPPATEFKLERITRDRIPLNRWSRTQNPVNEEGMWADGRERELLPVVEKIPDLIHALEEHQVVVLQSAAGTGKTTQLTEAIRLAFKDKWDNKKGIRIDVSQPTRNAVRWITERIAEIAGVKPGKEVAGQLVQRSTTFDDGMSPSEESELVLQVDESLLNRIITTIQQTGMLPQGVLFLDEAHLGKRTFFVAAAIIKAYLPYSPDTRVVVTSATLNKDLYTTFFQNDETEQDAPVEIEVEQQGSVVEIHRFELSREKREHHSQGAARAGRMIMGQMVASGKYLVENRPAKITQNESKDLFTIVDPDAAPELLSGRNAIGIDGQQLLKNAPREVRADGAIGIMVPSRADTEDVVNSLVDEAVELGLVSTDEADRFFSERNPERKYIRNAKVEIMAIHGGVPRGIIDFAGKPVPKGMKRFVVSTGDLIRNSVTIDGLVGVVDTLEVMRPDLNEHNVETTRKRATTLAEVIQGIGRLSRIREERNGKKVPIPGNYYAIVGEMQDDLNSIITKKEFPKPELLVVNLSQPALQLAAVGLDIRYCDFPFTHGEQLDQRYVTRTIALLQKLNALDENGVITPFGRELQRYPFDPELAASLYRAKEFDILPQTVQAVGAVAVEREITAVPRGYITLTETEARALFTFAGKDFADARSGDSPSVTARGRLYSIQLGRKDSVTGESVNEYFWKHKYGIGSQSDFVAAVNAYCDYMQTASRLPENAQKSWLISHGFNIEQVHIYLRNIKDLEDAVRKAGLSDAQRSVLRGIKTEEEARKLTIALASGLIDNISDRHVERTGTKVEKRIFYTSPSASTLGFIVSSASANNHESPHIIYGGKPYQHGRNVPVVHYSAPLDTLQLMGAVPQLVEQVPLKDKMKVHEGMVVVPVQTKFHNAVFSEDIQTVETNEACPVLAKFIYDNSKLFPVSAVNTKYIKYISGLRVRGWGLPRIPYIERDEWVLKKWYQKKLEEHNAYTVEAAMQIAEELTITDAVLESYGMTGLSETRKQIEEQRPLTWIVDGQEYALTYCQEDSYYVPGEVKKPYRVVLQVPYELKGRIPLEQLPDMPGLVTYVDYVKADGTYNPKETFTIRATKDIEADYPKVAFSSDTVKGLTTPEGYVYVTDGLTATFNVGRAGETITVPVVSMQRIEDGYSEIKYTFAVIVNGETREFTKTEHWSGYGDRSLTNAVERVKTLKRDFDELVKYALDQTSYEGGRIYSKLQWEFRGNYTNRTPQKTKAVISHMEALLREYEGLPPEQHTPELDEKHSKVREFLEEEQKKLEDGYPITTSYTPLESNGHAPRAAPRTVQKERDPTDIRQGDILGLRKVSEEDQEKMIGQYLTRGLADPIMEIINKYFANKPSGDNADFMKQWGARFLAEYVTSTNNDTKELKTEMPLVDLIFRVQIQAEIAKRVSNIDAKNALALTEVIQLGETFWTENRDILFHAQKIFKEIDDEFLELADVEKSEYDTVRSRFQKLLIAKVLKREKLPNFGETLFKELSL